MSSRWGRAALCAAVVASSAGLTASVTPSAEALPPTTATYVTVNDNSRESVGGPAHHLWTGAEEVSVSGDLETGITVRAEQDGPRTGMDLVLNFAAPEGGRLAAGTYDDAVHVGPHTGPHPGISVFGDIIDPEEGKGCDAATGSFVVHDVAPDLSHLSISYEQHCGDDHDAIFGEIRYEQPRPSGRTLVVAPDSIEWPASYRGAPSRVPVTLANHGAGPVSVGALEVLGGAGAFSADRGDCRTLRTGGTCEAWVTYRPIGFAASSATLVIDSSEGSDAVPLSGSVVPGYTSWRMHSQEKSGIGEGADFDYTPSNSSMHAQGYPFWVSLRLDAGDYRYWTADFTPETGASLRPGATYPLAARYGYSDGHPGLDVDGLGAGCNILSGSFTVQQVVFDQDQHMTGFAATFEQHCYSFDDGTLPALTGSIAWHAPSPAAPVPTAPKLSSRMTLGPERQYLQDGGRAVLGGSLAWGSRGSGLEGELVTLWARPHERGVWTQVASTRSGTAGQYQLALVANRGTDYQTRFGSDSDFIPITSRTVTVLPRWHATLTLARYVKRKTARLRAAVVHGRRGQVVLLQKRGPNGWESEARARLSSRGTASFTVPLLKRRAVFRRIFVRAGDGRLESGSNELYVADRVHGPDGMGWR